METLDVLLTLLVASLVYYAIKSLIYNKWKQCSIPYRKNRLPIFGHVLPAFLGRKSLSMICQDMYKSVAPASMCGFYFMNKPALLIRDPELVKCVFQTNFQNFYKNAMHADQKVDPIISNHPFFNAGESWKLSRTRMTYNFTKRKLTLLSSIVDHVCQKLIDYTDRKIQEDHGVAELELKDYFVKCTGEIVANSLGMEGHSFEDNPNDYSFAKIARIFFKASPFLHIQQILMFYMSELTNLLGVTLIPSHVDRHFRRFLNDIIDHRQNSGQASNDYLQFILEYYKDNCSEDLLTSEAIAFYIDVYETTSLTLSFFFYRLANNPKVQKKLREEIKSVLEANDGQLNFDSLKDLVYLEQGMFESLRMNPSAAFFMKECTKKMVLEGKDGLKCPVRPGDFIFICATSLHNDPEYWDNPHVYDPERFSPNNKIREKFAFLPFGEGPRMCVGRRMAMMVAKLATASIISRYAVEPTLDKNELRISAKNNPLAVLAYAEGGIWARFRKLRPEEL